MWATRQEEESHKNALNTVDQKIQQIQAEYDEDVEFQALELKAAFEAQLEKIMGQEKAVPHRPIQKARSLEVALDTPAKSNRISDFSGVNTSDTSGTKKVVE